ncbi:MAG: cation transporter [Alphaproteobacteria bacterium]|nr:cation transporter [Alphaproteobacteria bacterium]
MKTSVIEVRDMLSVLSVLGVEKRIGEVPGVESVTVNFAGASATVRYDETRLEIADIKSSVRQSGFESADAPAAGRATASAGDGHKGHTAPGAPPPNSAPAVSKTPPVAAGPADSVSASAAQQDRAAPDTAASTYGAPKPPAVAASAAPKVGQDAATSTHAPASDGQKDKAAPKKS